MAKQTIPDAIFDEFTQQDIDLVRLEAQLVNELNSSELRRLERELVALIRQAGPGESRSAAIRRNRANRLIQEAVKLINRRYRNMQIILNRHMKDLFELEDELTRAAINNGVGGTLATGKLSKAQVRKLLKDLLIEGASSRQWWSRQALSLRNKFSEIILKGVRANDSTGNMVRAIRGSRSAGYTDGIMKGKYKQTELLVRTSIQTVANEARLASYRANSDIIRGIRWSSTLDGRTTTTCQGLDGLMWDLDYKPIGGHGVAFPGPTAHWACRSSQVPVLVPYSSLTKGKRKRVPVGTRESMDGLVSAKHNYNSWLKTKSKEFQIDVLGKTKYDLWKKGKLSMRDLIDQSGNPLTLNQIRDAISGAGG